MDGPAMFQMTPGALARSPYRRSTLVLCLAIFALAAGPGRAADFATQMLDATYKLFNKDSTATGFFVRDPVAALQGRPRVILVTAGHVLEKMTSDTAIIVLRRPNDTGGYTREDISVPIRTRGKALWQTHPDHDVAVMRVKLPMDADVKPLPFDSLATEEAFGTAKLHIASPLFMMGFPTRFESNGAGFPVARHASIASFPLTPVKLQKTFLADFTTFGGDSGGPVFMPDPRRQDPENAPPLVVGLVLSQFRHDEKIQTLNEERTIHYPLGLSTVLDAPFIREAIERLPK